MASIRTDITSSEDYDPIDTVGRAGQTDPQNSQLSLVLKISLVAIALTALIFTGIKYGYFSILFAAAVANPAAAAVITLIALCVIIAGGIVLFSSPEEKAQPSSIDPILPESTSPGSNSNDLDDNEFEEQSSPQTRQIKHLFISEESPQFTQNSLPQETNSFNIPPQKAVVYNPIPPKTTVSMPVVSQQSVIQNNYSPHIVNSMPVSSQYQAVQQQAARSVPVTVKAAIPKSPVSQPITIHHAQPPAPMSSQPRQVAVPPSPAPQQQVIQKPVSQNNSSQRAPNPQPVVIPKQSILQDSRAVPAKTAVIPPTQVIPTPNPPVAPIVQAPVVVAPQPFAIRNRELLQQPELRTLQNKISNQTFQQRLSYLENFDKSQDKTALLPKLNNIAQCHYLSQLGYLEKDITNDFRSLPTAKKKQFCESYENACVTPLADLAVSVRLEIQRAKKRDDKEAILALENQYEDIMAATEPLEARLRTLNVIANQ